MRPIMSRFTQLLALALLLPPALTAQNPGQVVGVQGQSTLGNPAQWTPVYAGTGFAEVTDRFACGLYSGTSACAGGFGNVGSGALELGVSGTGALPAGYADWAFFYLLKDDGFGDLRTLSSLSFDWYRASVPGWTESQPVGSLSNVDNQAIPPADWAYKTPVLRLMLREDRGEAGTFLSELVWEGYFNQCRLGTDADCSRNETPLDTWVRQYDMQQDNFWYARTTPDGGRQYSRNGACDATMSIWDGGMNAASESGLFGTGGCLAGASVTVVGIGVGVGNQWPLGYRGAVDNVRMAFEGQEVVNANFDFVTVVPEPSTYALMAGGLLALAGIARRRGAAVRRHAAMG